MVIKEEGEGEGEEGAWTMYSKVRFFRGEKNW
jgi:hypothetical protein